MASGAIQEVAEHYSVEEFRRSLKKAIVRLLAFGDPTQTGPETADIERLYAAN
jgi:hypothetical protein